MLDVFFNSCSCPTSLLLWCSEMWLVGWLDGSEAVCQIWTFDKYLFTTHMAFFICYLAPRGVKLSHILCLPCSVIVLTPLKNFQLIALYHCALDMFFVLLFSYSPAGNAYSTGRQCGYSVAPINLCKSLLSAFAKGNLLFQMWNSLHEIAILHNRNSVKGRSIWWTHKPFGWIFFYFRNCVLLSPEFLLNGAHKHVGQHLFKDWDISMLQDNVTVVLVFIKVKWRPTLR